MSSFHGPTYLIPIHEKKIFHFFAILCSWYALVHFLMLEIDDRQLTCKQYLSITMKFEQINNETNNLIFTDN
jgi:hypothetical protein